MAINTDAERAEFEAWARDQYQYIDLARDGDGYSRFLENDYWSLWQAARRTQAAPVPAQEPFGYFKAEPFGWRDCAETDEGAIALYEAPQAQAEARDAERYRWLVQPDVALQKCRLARRALAGVADLWGENGYGFAVEEPRGVLGRVFAIERIEPFDPRGLRRELRGRGAELLKHDFPLSGEELARRLGVRRGGGPRLAFTRIEGRFWTIRLK